VGRRWHPFLQDAYNNGVFESLFAPYAGSLQTVQRIAAVLALLVPLSYVPLLFNLLAIAIQVLPAALLWIRRFQVWCRRETRTVYGRPSTVEIWVSECDAMRRYVTVAKVGP
jgi:hypothetical protein